MIGTCVVKGECGDGGGIPAGSCSTVTSQAVCCTCKYSNWNYSENLSIEMWIFMVFF